MTALRVPHKLNVSKTYCLGENAAKLVDYFVRKAASRSSMPYSIMKNYWTQRLTIALRVTSMQCLQDSALNNPYGKTIVISEVVDTMGIHDTDCVCNNMFSLTE